MLGREHGAEEESSEERGSLIKQKVNILLQLIPLPIDPTGHAPHPPSGEHTTL
jgi:hypothetical protein